MLAFVEHGSFVGARWVGGSLRRCQSGSLIRRSSEVVEVAVVTCFRDCFVEAGLRISYQTSVLVVWGQLHGFAL